MHLSLINIDYKCRDDILLGITLTPLHPAPTVPSGCTDPFLPYLRSRGAGAILQSGQFTLTQCAGLCLSTSPGTGTIVCWGFDYIDLTQECSIIFNDYTPMVADGEVNSYKRTFLCVTFPQGKNPLLTVVSCFVWLQV